MAWRNTGGRLRREAGSAEVAWLPAAVEEELAHQVRRVHWALGEGQDPQDVEWAYDGEHLWLLQARPVTRMPRASWPETATMPRYWSTANIKDAVPGVVCELSWSLLQDGVGDAAYAVQQAVGYPMPPGMEVVRRFHGRGFFDLTMMQWALYDALGVLPAEAVQAIGGYQPEIAVPTGSPMKGAAGRRRSLARLRLVRQIWDYPATARPVIEKRLADHRGLPDTSGLSREELRQALSGLIVEDAFLRVAGLANACSGPWQLGLEALVKDLDLIGRLSAGAGSVTSAEHGYRLYEIARGESTMEQFLHDFGHRAVYEVDLLNPRWAEDAAWIREQVGLIGADVQDPRQRSAELRRQAEAELRRRFGWRTPLLMWLVRKLRASMAVRESAKSALICVLLPLRRIALEIGRRLVAAGHLDAPEPALHLTVADLFCWLRGDWDGTGARELAADRAARRERWLAEPAPDLITEEPDGRMMVEPIEERAGEGFRGIAVSPGVATGIARIVRTPADAGHLRQGDILIAPSTDPGWTPLFLRSSAIVMETGGFLSHGAIVAREYGLPAVANVPGILAALRDGESVTVDGSRGRVIRND